MWRPRDLVAPLEGQAPAAPHLSYRGGPLLTAVKVFTVYWGAAWQQVPLSATADSLDRFFQFVLTSIELPVVHLFGNSLQNLRVRMPKN